VKGSFIQVGIAEKLQKLLGEPQLENEKNWQDKFVAALWGETGVKAVICGTQKT
jgi:hypothetical protein